MPHLKTENIRFNNPTSEFGYSWSKIRKVIMRLDIVNFLKKENKWH
jgi:hypothetical protein